MINAPGKPWTMSWAIVPGRNDVMAPSISDQSVGPSSGLRVMNKKNRKGSIMNRLPFDLNKLIELCRENGVVEVGVFGSIARGEADEESDVDLVVKFSKPISLLKMVALERQLSDALGKKVDLLTEAAISPYLREGIKRDMQVIYEAG